MFLGTASFCPALRNLTERFESEDLNLKILIGLRSAVPTSASAKTSMSLTLPTPILCLPQPGEYTEILGEKPHMDWTSVRQKPFNFRMDSGLSPLGRLQEMLPGSLLTYSLVATTPVISR